MKHTELFKEARRLYDLGFAIHWLHPKSKRPVESGWTTGPRKEWNYLKETYYEGLNVGVRLGTPSVIENGYLAVVDVDVKSTDERHRIEAVRAATELLRNAGYGFVASKPPTVISGRGNGSRHYYVRTARPFKTWNPASSPEMVKVHMPSKSPSKKEIAELTPDEIKQGIRIASAWEISLYSDGRQVVLPPSIHPDSGKPYQWVRQGSFPLVEFSQAGGEAQKAVLNAAQEKAVLNVAQDFEVEPVELAWLPISEKIREGILHGTNVKDRSSYLLPAAAALVSVGLTKNQVLTILTETDTFLGACAYDHARTTSRSRAADWLWKYTVKRVFEERDAESAFREAAVITPNVTLEGEALKAQTNEFASEIDWRDSLARSGTKGEGPPKGTLQNIVTILSNAISPEIIRRDEFAFRDSYGVDVPWNKKKGEAVTDDDVAIIRHWLGKKFRIEPKKEIIWDALVVLACRNAFNPVRDWLDTLQWDGKGRLSGWLKKNFQAEGDDEYLTQVFRKWMVAMVMRIYCPGSKFDWMPIFEGDQGVGKSSFGRILVGDNYFSDWLPNLGDKDASIGLQGVWCVEMGELATMRKNDIEIVKGFLTRTVDKFRPPHGRKMAEYPRHCVFFGTTNRDTYLRDDTGNRRFKPVKVGKLNFTALKREREQLFAEAKYLFESFNETEWSLNLSGDAQIFERKIHKEKMVMDDADLMKDRISDFIERVEKGAQKFDFLRFTINDLFLGTGPLVSWKYDSRNVQFAGKALRMLGGESSKSGSKRLWKLTIGTGF